MRAGGQLVRTVLTIKSDKLGNYRTLTPHLLTLHIYENLKIKVYYKYCIMKLFYFQSVESA